jgi:hypothetical protein
MDAFCCGAGVRLWHKADIVDVRFFGRYRGESRHGRKARKYRLMTQSEHWPDLLPTPSRLVHQVGIVSAVSLGGSN